MLTTGNQLKAARALVGMDQMTLAGKARISPNTVSAMEGRGSATLTSGLDTIQAVAKALEAAGVIFTAAGVQLAPDVGRRGK